MGKILNTIECEGMQVAFKVESTSKKKSSSYYPQTVILNIRKGTIHFEVNKQLYIATENDVVLFKKYTSGQLSSDKSGAIVDIFTLQDLHIKHFIEKVIPTAVEDQKSDDKLVMIPKNPALSDFFSEIDVLLKNNEQISRSKVAELSNQVIQYIIDIDSSYLNIISKFAEDKRPDLGNFMLHNYQLNVNLDELARMTGRSLSTFNREFKKIFRITPHRWILKKRLEKAHDILTNTNKTSTEIYQELGFADLAHFSRSFKKEFGFPPTSIVKKGI